MKSKITEVKILVEGFKSDLNSQKKYLTPFKKI